MTIPATLSRAEMVRELDELVRGATHVRINEQRLTELAALMGARLRDPSRDPDPTGNALNPEEAPTENTRETLQFFLMRRTQSFVIWRWKPKQSDVEAWDCTVNGRLYTGERAINACIMRALRRGVPLLDPAYLETMPLGDLEEIYRDEATGAVTFQLVNWRLEKLHELGRVLRERFGGHMANLLEESGGYLFRDDDRGAIQLLVRSFPKSYGDWPFAKLALTVMNALYTRRDSALPTSDEYARLTEIRDPHNFFGPADYYIPMFLARWGVFELSEEFGAHLRGRVPIEPNSQIEREFRAATMTIFDRLSQLTGLHQSVIDHECWYTGAFRCRPCYVGVDEAAVPCPYRSECLGFQHQHELMELAWPLVYTPYY